MNGTTLSNWSMTNSGKALRDFDMNDIKNYDDEESIGEQETSNKKLKSLNVPLMVSLIIAAIIFLFVSVACIVSSLHKVQEGYVGLYFKNGALLDDYSDPGIHWSQPFVTRVEMLLVRPETKIMNPLVCTTRDGVRNVFRDVQVISSIRKEKALELVREFGMTLKNILIYDRVAEAMQIFCSNHSIDEVYNSKFLDIIEFVYERVRDHLKKFAPENSIIIWNVFLPKPDVPPAIAENYKEVKVEWTKQLVAQQKQKTEEIEKETEKMKALADAEREKEVDRIEIEKKIQQEEGKKNVSTINNAIRTDKLRSESDAMSYVQEQEAASNKLLLTDEYIRLNVAKSLLNNTKMYFSGQDSVLGSALAQIFKNNQN